MRRWKRTTVTAALLTLLAAATSGTLAQAQVSSARAVLHDSVGNRVGAVDLTQTGDAVLVEASVEGLPPGFHGFHVHETGKCKPPFTSAGGHFNPTGDPHGEHAGDMPVLLVMDDGTAQLSFLTDRFTVDRLFDADRSAIIVHANADNYANIPTRYHSHTEDVFGPDSATLATGDAGGRIACGVIRTKP